MLGIVKIMVGSRVWDGKMLRAYAPLQHSWCRIGVEWWRIFPSHTRDPTMIFTMVCTSTVCPIVSHTHKRPLHWKNPRAIWLAAHNSFLIELACSAVSVVERLWLCWCVCSCKSNIMSISHLPCTRVAVLHGVWIYHEVRLHFQLHGFIANTT